MTRWSGTPGAVAGRPASAASGCAMGPGSATVLCAALLAAGCGESTVGPVPGAVPEFRGFTYTSFAADGFMRGGARDALGDLKTQIGNTWIALSLFEYQTNAFSSDIAPNTTGTNPLTGQPWPTTSTPDDLREGIRQARAAQMKIMLKPQVDLYSGEWRAAIRPGADGGWFRAYTAMMLTYARLAQELHVEMLCIGTEYVVATQGSYTPEWLMLISAIRREYTGKLVYAATWSGAYAQGVDRPEYQQIGFWKELDYIGVDDYFPLTASAADPLPEYGAAVSSAAAAAQAIGAVAALNARPVVITEIGIQSVKGALAAPWDYTLGAAAAAVVDTTAQEFYYRVMIDALGRQPWCSGMFWWNWESVPTANEATNYTPRNKPAARVLREWYGSMFALR